MSKRESLLDSAERRKRKKSRWSAVTETGPEKVVIPGMPTVVPCFATKEQEDQYLLHLQIEETSRRLRTGDLGIPPNPEDRSPSPEPIYNTEGKRLNTREYRTRKKLEEERHSLIQKAATINTEYKPPADYKPPTVKVIDKVWIPQDDHPDINFVGLLIGPRGNTLRNLEKETGAKIIIRGKGSVKEGKIGRKDGQPLPGEDEPLHAYITANNTEHVKKASDKIHDIIKQGIDVPEGQNDLRRQQLRELALLNGTLRENDGLAKLKQLQQAQTIVTNQIICTRCGGAGHLDKDCKQARPGDTLRPMLDSNQPVIDRAKMDSEYMSLMAELGEGPPPGADKQHLGPPTSKFTAPPPNLGSSPFQPRRSRFNEGPPPSASGSMLNPPWLQAAKQTLPPPPIVSTAPSLSMPPWQQQQQSAPPTLRAPPPAPPNMAVPSLMSLNAPPPPPPSTVNSPMPPWGGVPPPSIPPPRPWGHAPPPPGPPGIHPPWQAPPPPAPVAPPPPPPSSYGVPPPPPPSTNGGFSLSSLPGLNPFAPPPPPPQ